MPGEIFAFEGKLGSKLTNISGALLVLFAEVPFCPSCWVSLACRITVQETNLQAPYSAPRHHSVLICAKNCP